MISRRNFLLALAAPALVPTAGLARDFWGERLPDPPTDFIFGYGTLINEPSRTGTAGRRVEAVPARVASGFGYVRSWAARSRSGFTALGLRRPRAGEAPSTINGALYPAVTAEISAFDRRESGYRRVEIPLALIEPMGWQALPAGGRIWIYVPVGASGAVGEDLSFPDADYPIVQSYLDVVLEGALEHGEAFAGELVATTADWSRFWLNDRPIARRPWVENRASGAIDRLLAKVEPAAGLYAQRLFPEVYAARHLMRAPAEAR